MTLTGLLTKLRRLSNAKVPKENMHACQDALLTVYNGHIIAKACMEFNIMKPNETPSIAINLAVKIADELTVISQAVLLKPVPESNDGVHNYARVLCHYASLVVEFVEGWREGDGERVPRCWRVFLLHFHADRRTNYACESLRLQFQLASLPPYLVSQLTWDRFVNTHGGNGHNIPCDLHNEHVKCLFKEVVGHMGAKFTEEASTRAARTDITGADGR